MDLADLEFKNRIHFHEPSQADRIWKRLLSIFSENKSLTIPAWDAFRKPDRSLPYSTENILSVIAKNTTNVLKFNVVEESATEIIALHTDSASIIEVINKCRFPSDDWYIFSDNLDFLIVLTSYETILVYKNSNNALS